ncbi:helix-turn-helix domain-containing protein [uncultured Lactobacillus sp.]|uniref:helix-turn-helix domain-containing protein n=1 Tax=uncultured Lactobacillus sp. TaxID=153152 RepID=UPI00261BE985|nr:helix-turn-helix domain-containing protein [uncultured Lactobacillus sp.]
MKFEELQELFPQLQKNPTQDAYALRLEDGDAYLPKETLTQREKTIWQLLETKKIHHKLSSWQLYLNGQKSQPKVNSHLRFLYFQVKKLNKEERKQWQDQLLSFFGSRVAYFWQNPENVVVIDEQCHLSQEELNGILTTMDSDFLTTTHLLVGLVWDKKAELPAIFMEEEKINDSISWQSKVMTIPQAALSFYTQFNKKDSVILHTFRQLFNNQDDSKELVVNLYKVGGNVTQAAKNMFVHRNTLEYRIEKFMQKYHLNLHQMDDLVFCYLIFV